MLEQLMSKIHQLFFVWKTDVLQQDDLVSIQLTSEP